ncbi:MAG: rRNA pseudouridine synthase [Oscillospiraceae bacterium]|nr:rRNA pseudouridine synthase [Oscillospiraceae bacterium]
MKDRLQKIISASGLMSRRAAEECISAGRVSVNGVVAMLGDKADAETDIILLDGKPLPSSGEKLYIMLNKPKGYVTTLKDEKGRKNVTELVKELGSRVYPVGRLDMYSEGLLIMTNDGDFANRLMHPSHQIDKTYLTWVTGEDIGFCVELLRQPMEIDGYVISPADVYISELKPGGAVLSITIHEGRNRQVRKMCELAGLKVTRLKRVSEGHLELGDLKSGKWRHLTQSEIDSFLQE